MNFRKLIFNFVYNKAFYIKRKRLMQMLIQYKKSISLPKRSSFHCNSVPNSQDEVLILILKFFNYRIKSGVSFNKEKPL
jgi:hypothetical protein